METQYQASEPEGLEDQPPGLTGASSSRKKVERSCIMCHQRKIRCNKSSPCSNCVRVDVLCCYPSVQERSERRHHKTTITEVAARLARLERTITALSKDAPAKESNGQPAESLLAGEVTGDVQNQESSPKSEFLVQEGGTSRYFNEFLLSKILTEEDELRSVIGSPRADENTFQNDLPFDNGDILFGSYKVASDLQSLTPTRWQAAQLWQIFQNNVDPVVKILHIPTTQVDVFSAIADLETASGDMKALLFSIYFAATTTLSPTEVTNLLNQSREAALHKFKGALQQALSMSQILDSPSMKSLQALAIYIVCLRAHDRGRAGWALNGLILRLAKSVGLHRDGKNFGLSPFESEMRRRLWHQIDTADVRASEDLGISLSSTDLSIDTALPLNLDDIDLSVDMESLPVAKKKWTGMTLSRLQLEAAYVGQQVVQNIGHSSATMSSQTSRDEILKAHLVHVENSYLKYCNENIPVQRLTATMVRGYLIKLDFLMRHQNPSIEIEESPNDPYASDEGLIEGCLLIEAQINWFSDEMLKGFQWYLRTFFQYYILTDVLRHLCANPNGPHSARAFKTVDDSFKMYNYRQDHGPKWTFMLQLRAKAERARASSNQPNQVCNEQDASTWLQDFSAPSEIPNDFAGWNTAGQSDLFNWTNFPEDFGM
ncbi:fungal specific transcription factor [Phlyctema vagabunda]|uniref:Fungal specific transcription factor n=1 Tax=Phlyctema vagabunda TaxID=108571 RepID=A0ABR4PG67_9HELO